MIIIYNRIIIKSENQKFGVFSKNNYCSFFLTINNCFIKGKIKIRITYISSFLFNLCNNSS